VEWLSNPDAWIGLVTLVVMEVVLGVDNVVFISILAGKLPTDQQARARQMGLALALIMRIVMLLMVSWISQVTTPLFSVLGQDVSGRDLILLIGGVFLIAKATHEIHDRLEGETGHASAKVAPSFTAVIAQILVLDVVFSLDSVITAVGLVDHTSIMVIAIVIAVGVMMVAAKPIGDFVDENPTFKMLALSFLLMIGLTLMVEGFDVHVPKGYIYFAMFFSVMVEVLNMQVRKRKQTRTITLNKAIKESYVEL